MRKLLLMLFMFSPCSMASVFVYDAYFGGYPSPFFGEVVGRDAEHEYMLRDDAAAAYYDMRAAARDAGFDLSLNSAYRTTADQRRMMRQRKRWAAPIGYSLHQSGIAIDLAGTSHRCRGKKRRVCRSAFHHWLRQNAPTYGWQSTAPKEPWHWVYVGLDDSSALHGKVRGIRTSFLRPPECSY
jgi:LAS superfamily LD-carboxypeptidase LdcB